MNDHVHLKLGIWNLACVGFWPLKFESKRHEFIYNSYFKLTFSIYIIFVLTQFVEMYQLFQNKKYEEVSDLIGTLLLYLGGLVKLSVINGKAVQRLTRKIRVTEKAILKSDEEDVKKIYLEHVKAIHTVNKVWSGLAVVCYFLFTSTPILADMVDPPTAYFDLIDNNTMVYRPRPLPLVSWFPFDRYKHYKLSFAWHMVILTFVSAYVVSANNFLFGLTIFAIGQIKILQQSLLNFKEAIRSANQSDEVSVENLRKCIIYHKAIITFVSELNDAMKIFLMLDFLVCGLQMAVIGFRAAVMDVSFILLNTVMYLLAMLTQLFLFYWFGNEIILESREIVKAVWESEWYLYSENIKRSLIIIMIRAQKSLTLSVGPFYQMSTETMMMIIRVGYSYAAIMRRFYRK